MTICKNSFLFLHSITLKHFKNLCYHFDSEGLVPHIHGNTKKIPHNALPLETTQHELDFITNHAENHALPPRGHLPSHWDFQVMLFPTDTTKLKVYSEYKKACDMELLQCCSKSHFMYYWRTQVPCIRIMKPYTDLCNTCQQMSWAVSLTSNLHDEEKLVKLENFLST